MKVPEVSTWWKRTRRYHKGNMRQQTLKNPRYHLDYQWIYTTATKVNLNAIALSNQHKIAVFNSPQTKPGYLKKMPCPTKKRIVFKVILQLLAYYTSWQINGWNPTSPNLKGEPSSKPPFSEFQPSIFQGVWHDISKKSRLAGWKSTSLAAKKGEEVDFGFSRPGGLKFFNSKKPWKMMKHGGWKTILSYWILDDFGNFSGANC